MNYQIIASCCRQATHFPHAGKKMKYLDNLPLLGVKAFPAGAPGPTSPRFFHRRERLESRKKAHVAVVHSPDRTRVKDSASPGRVERLTGWCVEARPTEV